MLPDSISEQKVMSGEVGLSVALRGPLVGKLGSFNMLKCSSWPNISCPQLS